MADAASAAQTGVETDLAGLPGLAGRELGATAWQQMTQERVDAFADATDDHQFIHVDPARAGATPFGGTIAHGFLTLSLLAPACRRLLTVNDAAMTVNYGLDRVRFPAPLPVGAWFRATARVSEARPLDGAVQVHLTVTVEVRNGSKPAAVAELLLRFYA